MLSLLHLVNQDRVKLRDMNFVLLSEFTKGSNSDFERFVENSQRVHYELLKFHLEKARLQIENMKNVIFT